ncbi:MAG: VanW family protein [Bacillota bacterium]
MRRILLWVAAFLISGVLIGTLALFLLERAYVRPEVIVPGVSIGGMPFEGLTTAEGLVKLRAYEAELISKPVRLECAGRVWRLPLRDTGAHVDTVVLEQALAVGHEGWLLRRYWERYRVSKSGRNIPLKVKVDQKRAASFVAQLTKGLTVLPQNAGIKVLPDDSVVIIPGREGCFVDSTSVCPQLIAILTKGKEPVVRVPLKSIPPEHTTAEVVAMGIEAPLGEFTTTFDPTKVNRVYNISVAAGALNGLLVQPGEVVSFNKIVGPRSSEAGYKEAPTIINNEFVDSLGGGVCQVSTTLYNAVLLSGLEVVERHNHSLPVTYVPAGRDATVAYGGSDLQFRNNTDKYLYVRTVVTGNRLTIKILGNKKFKRKVELRSWVTETLKPKVIRREDANLEAGKEVVKQKGIRGCRAKAERIIWDGDKKTTEQLRSSFYHPLDEIVAVGTKVVPVVVAPKKPVETKPQPDPTGQETGEGVPELPAPETGVNTVYGEIR